MNASRRATFVVAAALCGIGIMTLGNAACSSKKSFEEYTQDLASPGPAKQRRAADRLVEGAPGSVAPMTEELFRRKSSTSMKAAGEVLARIGPGAAGPFLDVLSHTSFPDNIDDEFFKIEVIHVLGRFADARGVAPLIACLKSERREAVQQAQNALEQIGSPAADALLGCVRQGLRSVASPLSKLGSPIVDPLLEILKNGSPDARSVAAETLGLIGDKRAIEGLDRVRSDEDLLVQENAVRALGLMVDDERAVRALVKTLLSENSYFAAAGAAAEALGRSRNELAFQALTRALDKSQSSLVQPSIAAALAHSGDPRALGLLIRAFKGDFGVEAGIALASTGAKAIPLLLEAATDADESVRMHSVSTLGKIRDPIAVECLLDRLEKDKSDLVRECAAKALTRSDDTRAKARLAEIWEKEDPQVIAWCCDYYAGLEMPHKLRTFGNALKKTDNKSLAEVMLNSGEEDLRTAAEKWVKTKGYTIRYLETDKLFKFDY